MPDTTVNELDKHETQFELLDAPPDTSNNQLELLERATASDGSHGGGDGHGGGGVVM